MKAIGKLRDTAVRLTRLLRKEIWEIGSSRDETLVFRLLRILSIIWQGVGSNRLFSQSAALSYYSLIGLGPLLAISIMISSFILDKEKGDNLAVEGLTRVVLFVAPPTSQWSDEEHPAPSGEEGETGTETPEINPAVLSLVNQIVASARSGTVGVAGSLILIFLVIQMITSIEKSFNEIWGVRRGRSWAQRIVSYWTIISLGAVLGFAALTVLSASTFVRVFESTIPWIDYQEISFLAAPLLSFLLITLLLGFFNRFFPHTTVLWVPALLGGAVAATLLLANHTLSFLYVDRVIQQKSLYGSVGIIPVLMLGLYMFWFIVLLGGLVTYAVQNANNVTNQAAWRNVSPLSREALCLTAFLFVARRFLHCQPPPSSSEIADRLRAPGKLLNSCLIQLADLGWLSPLEPDPDDEDDAVRYQPGMPLERLTLARFREDFERAGNNTGVDMLASLEPVLSEYREGFTPSELVQTPISRLLEQAPKATGESD